MKFDTPATTNPIDQLKVVGKPVDRIDGVLKTTGTAPYAYERHDVAPNPAYGYIVGSAIAKGRIRSMDLEPPARARRARHRHGADAGKLGKGKFNTAKLLAGRRSSTTTRRGAGGGRDLRAGARGGAAGARRLRAHAGHFDLAKAKDGG
jgi:xanthine dehydrogenase YagR molybdenum-binding subunit